MISKHKKAIANFGHRYTRQFSVTIPAKSEEDASLAMYNSLTIEATPADNNH